MFNQTQKRMNVQVDEHVHILIRWTICMKGHFKNKDENTMNIDNR
jgi:hypothetical protein